MAQKKFGTFGGVFTPSILTILGVIMYMRLPWIVGNAGLFLTIGIILVAHIVSVTTGLSVSSIATDKHVKAGGTYFIISRSLGLPIGGTLGIALFFGLSLSVSLYIIGFSESFLGFWDFPIDKDTIRLTGTIALLLVGTLTFISTSLAIKTQYFIMTAIVLSLVTIFFGKHDFAPIGPILNPVENAAPIILLFAIFFPAVTGFEAGVSMSGDLQDPKKSIPKGTISAIIIGLVVYIGLAIFFASTVSSDQLINNPNILLEISFFPPLLVAGIWGATLSSAIGSILGAPRILQATSLDHITPKIFGKGFGPTNEPRNALLLTFVIAEIGILIGELNLIARVVSMFFITTYGFLNLSSTIEKLVSTDFRPTFKIPVWVSILGATVSIILMLELDFIAFIGAVIIMGTIFLYLKKKELTLESGDTWEGVWSSILRSGLNRLNKAEIKQRNWRPNIILFSGGKDARPHLIQFGKWLVKKRGVLSNFILTENSNIAHLIKRPKENSVEKTQEFEGIFTRELEVNDIYDGMETITKLYGFAGIEPNTIMLGWARESKKTKAFTQLLRVYQKLDYNIFLIDYDKVKQFGDKRTIDLWWRGSNNNATLALTVIKFLQMDEDWDDVKVRIFIVTNDSSIHNRVYKNVNQILDDQRIKADVKIINNSIDYKPFQKIIDTESKNTDLVIIGLPNIEKDTDLIENIDNIIVNLNSVLLIHASSFFKPIYIGIEESILKIKEKENLQLPTEVQIKEIILPQNELLAKPIKDFNDNFLIELNTFNNEYINKINLKQNILVEALDNLTKKTYNDLIKYFDSENAVKNKKVIARAISNFIFNTKKIIESYNEQIILEQADLLGIGFQTLINNLNSFKENYAAELIHEIDLKKLTDEKKNIFSIPFRKVKKVKINLSGLFNNLNSQIKNQLVINYLNSFGTKEYQFITELQRLFNSQLDSLKRIETLFDNNKINKYLVQDELKKIEGKILEISSELNNKNNQANSEIYNAFHNIIQIASNNIQEIDVNKKIKNQYDAIKTNKFEFSEFPAIWQKNQKLLTNFFIEDLYLKIFQNRSETILQKFLDNLLGIIDFDFKNIVMDIDLQISKIKHTNQTIELNQTPVREFKTNEIINALSVDLNNATEMIPDLIEIMNTETYQQLDSNPFGEPSVLEINLKNYLSYIVENDLVEKIHNLIMPLDVKLNKSIDTSLDVVRFTNYNIIQDTEDNEILIDSIIERSNQRIKNELKNINNLIDDLTFRFSQIKEDTFNKLNPYLVTKNGSSLKHIVRVQESKEIIGTIQSTWNKLKINTSKLIVDLVYRKSEGMIFAKKIKEEASKYQTSTGKILEFVTKNEPHYETINSLPFYYKQLFLGKHIRSKEFLIERNIETETAINTYNNYKNIRSGALLVLGERYSGKTTLCNTIANQLFTTDKIFEVNGYETGSIDLNDFEKQLSVALKQKGDINKILNSLSSDCAIIINDLELWWERSSNGIVIIEAIKKIIEDYSSKIFFIVNTNQYSFKLINKILPIENIFINSIHCQPYDAEEIKDALLLRHRSSGLKFEYLNQTEDQISNLKLANLFNTYFEISKGNIGTAIFTWLSNISDFNEQEIIIKRPQDFGRNALLNLNKDWQILLQQFIYYKLMNKERLARMFNIEITTAEVQLNELKRSGLITELQNNVYQINPYIQAALTNNLSEMRLL